MTEAVLAWQAIILATIGFAGRWRWWVAAFWVVWTLVQVTALPLSVLQFATIGLGSWIFTPKSPKTDHRPSTQAPILFERPAAAVVSPEHEPIKPEPPSLLTKLDTWATDTERRTREMTQRHAFERAAQQTIKTSDFSCEVEEQIMKEALARDRELTRKLESQLAADSVLRSLYDRALIETSKIRSSGVASRQRAEQKALQIAQRHRTHLDWLYARDERARDHYYASLTEANNRLLEAGLGKKDDPLLILGRHHNDWLDDIRKLKDRTSAQAAAPATLNTASSLLETIRRAAAVMSHETPKSDEPAASTSPASSNEGAASVGVAQETRECPTPVPTIAYVTQATFSRLAREWFHPGDVSIDAIFDFIYNQSLSQILNQKEAAEMYVRKSLIRGRASDLTAGDRTFSKKYVFSVGQSKFHASSDCPYLLSEFRNYLVPKEIERLGLDKVREFQTFCEKNKHELRDKTPDAFWAHVSAHFRLSISPQPVTLPNSGAQHINSASLDEIEMRINKVISEVKGMLEAEKKDSPVSRMRYAGNPGRAVAQVKDKQAQERVARFFELKKELLKLLFDFYKKEHGVKDLALPVELLLEAHLGPCKGCWPKSGATQQLN